MPDFKAVIEAEMSRQKMSTYELVKRLRGKRPAGKDVPASTVYGFLGKKQSAINADDLGLIFDVLGLDITKKP